jgi:hypothetical protein
VIRLEWSILTIFHGMAPKAKMVRVSDALSMANAYPGIAIGCT